MFKRMFLMLALTAVVLAGLGAAKFQQIQTAAAQAAAMQPPPDAVTTLVVAAEPWPDTLPVIGTTAAVQGVTVAADLPGLVSRIAFESGRAVREGDVLVELDTRQEQAQLAALEAQRELAHLTYDRMQGLLNERVISQAEFDRELAKRFDNMADRLEGKTSSPNDALERRLASLDELGRIAASDTRHDSSKSLHTFLPLSRRIASLTAALDEEVRSGLDSP